MCQYQYHYYGYCKHQEFILVKLCEGTISLAHLNKHRPTHNTEVATDKALPTDTTHASSLTAKSDFCTTPSIVLTGQVDHSIYPSSNIIHIIVRFVLSSNLTSGLPDLTCFSAMALDTHEMRLVFIVALLLCATVADYHQRPRAGICTGS